MSVLTERMTKGQLTRSSLVAGIILWFLHLNISYGLSSVGCKWGWFTNKIGPLSTMQLTEAIITLVALLLMFPLIAFPLRRWLDYQTGKPPRNPNMLQETEEDRHPFLSFVAFLSNSLLALFMIATFVPIFALSPCGPL
jgi:hypothetical protein